MAWRITEFDIERTKTKTTTNNKIKVFSDGSLFYKDELGYGYVCPGYKSKVDLGDGEVHSYNDGPTVRVIYDFAVYTDEGVDVAFGSSESPTLQQVPLAMGRELTTKNARNRERL